ncbi:MAG: hypothetical protein MSA91_12320 [Lachnobacterium sp.]|nr:hypothetical protein [Lachnobacterium sp.]
MEIKYGVTGKQRKAMVTAVASIIGADAIYKGVPTCNYEVDYFTIDRSGTLIFDDSADSEEVEHLIEALAERGFVAEQVEPEGEDEGCGVEISIPADRVNAENMEKLLESKKELICRALGVSNLPIEVTDTVVKFPWFSELPDADIIKAYTVFCKHFLDKVAKHFWTLLQVQIGQSCKASTGSYPASRIAIADHI